MSKTSLKAKILLSLLAAGSISVYGFVNTAAAEDIDGNDNGGNLTLNTGEYGRIDGKNQAENGEVTGGNVYISGNLISQSANGGRALTTNVDVHSNKITIEENAQVKYAYGGNSNNKQNVDVYDNEITVRGNANLDTVYAGASQSSLLYKNKVLVEGYATIKNVYGGTGVGSDIHDNEVVIAGNATITGNNGAGGIFGGANDGMSSVVKGTIYKNTITIKENAKITGGDIWGGNGNAHDNTINIEDNAIIDGDIVGSGTYYSFDAYGNNINIKGGTINATVYGGYSGSGNINNNVITISNIANIKNADLYGGYSGSGTVENNKLKINNWSGDVKGVYNFSDIDFDNITWDSDGTVLNIINNTEDSALADTNINLNKLNFEGGAELTTGDSMTFINGEKLGIDAGKVIVADEFTAGVATVGTGAVEVDENSVKYTLTEVKQNSQVNLVAENRAVAAAFVNQGTDLISDSLDALSRDSNYGVKTFAAVHGNRSKYDVNSDIKINGWSVIAGVGNADKFDNGSEFSWGVFYENGSSNYRTYNEFNNEFFRGDGSLVYNGGGIAARYTNKNGVYTEGSLRAGMLKSHMDNALRDGAGNFYGYESESAYYGAHIGIGKIISLSESSDLDVYGKFFHTYTEGDSFKVAGDEFDFDSITSDRLRVGARITSNKENKFSTYYGLAYEYEFNGDADMTAQELKAPTQSLQGSSVMAEVGFNYQPTPDSPWSFDINMRGYTGERQGGSFNVQATYTF